ncbi:hypothetical protein DB347_06625 [Opitutaceae bacterium EW11]|nr:hypothetical protein DB347_06625 [Opitutaceae bacterium EW11]
MKKICRIGCVGLLSDLPLYVAHARGLFVEQGIEVALSTELGWASVEARLSSGKLSAANVPALMPLALAAGLGKSALPLHAIAPTSYQGQAIVLSTRAHALLSNAARPATPVRIGVESPYAFSTYFLQSWIKRSHPTWADRITTMPIAVSQAIDLLKDGHIHGLCCAEPVCRVATTEGVAITLTRSSELFPGHLESLLACTENFLSTDEAAVRRIAAAIETARQYCARPENQPEALRIFLEQKSAIITSSSAVPGALGGDLELSRLIRFEAASPAAPAAGLGAVEPLIAATLALPGVRVSESDLRQAAGKIFAPLRTKPPVTA